MFRILPHRLLAEPRVTQTEVSTTAERAIAVMQIEGLVCSACAANVKRQLEDVPGVTSADVDLDQGRAEVHYERGATGPEALVNAVEGAAILRPLRLLLARLAGHSSQP